MSAVFIDINKCDNCLNCLSVCPLAAIQHYKDILRVLPNCNGCKHCLAVCENEAIAVKIQAHNAIDKSLWQGILIVIDHHNSQLTQATLALLQTARELAKTHQYQVHGVVIGHQLDPLLEELTQYPFDHLWVYDSAYFQHFLVEYWQPVLLQRVGQIKPCLVLLAANDKGRALAPWLAAYFNTGVTADCTQLKMRPNSDVIQIRPAFSGQVIAHIVTPYHRPQIATLHPHTQLAQKHLEYKTDVTFCDLTEISFIEIFISSITQLPETKVPLSVAKVVIVAGRGVKQYEDFQLIQQLAKELDAKVGVSRALVENGWFSVNEQVGLSGQTLQADLVITLGVSGSSQFLAGVRQVKKLIAINQDADAPIFMVADVSVMGDWYQLLPLLIEKINAQTVTY